MWPFERRGLQAKGRARGEAGICLEQCSKNNEECSVGYHFFFLFLLMEQGFSFVCLF